MTSHDGVAIFGDREPNTLRPNAFRDRGIPEQSSSRRDRIQAKPLLLDPRFRCCGPSQGIVRVRLQPAAVDSEFQTQEP
eukprot:1152380-Rhodomonas_salina.1